MASICRPKEMLWPKGLLSKNCVEGKRDRADSYYTLEVALNSAILNRIVAMLYDPLLFSSTSKIPCSLSHR